jgi:hypothetical protein
MQGLKVITVVKDEEETQQQSRVNNLNNKHKKKKISVVFLFKKQTFVGGVQEAHEVERGKKKKPNCFV